MFTSLQVCEPLRAHGRSLLVADFLAVLTVKVALCTDACHVIHGTSGDTEQIADKLAKGLLDFLVLAELPDSRRYEYLAFPEKDVWVLILPEGDPLEPTLETTLYIAWNRYQTFTPIAERFLQQLRESFSRRQI